MRATLICDYKSKSLYWFSKMAVIGSRIHGHSSHGYLIRFIIAGINSFMLNRLSSSIRQVLVFPMLKMPLWHHWRYFVRPVITVPLYPVGILIVFFPLEVCTAPSAMKPVWTISQKAKSRPNYTTLLHMPKIYDILLLWNVWYATLFIITGKWKQLNVLQLMNV